MCCKNFYRCSCTKSIGYQPEPKPEFVPPPPCIPCTTDGGDIDDAIEVGNNKSTVLFFSLALNLILIVFLGWMVK